MALSPGRPRNPPTPRQLLKDIIPVNDLFKEDEVVLYTSFIDYYLNDFKDDDLSASDLDDIASLATNKVMELRLLKDSKNSTAKQSTVSTSLEKIRKHNEALKTGLSSRRKDRIDPHEYKGFSIVDLAIAFDEERRHKLDNKSVDIRKQASEAAKLIRSYGNKDDIDGEQGVE